MISRIFLQGEPNTAKAAAFVLRCGSLAGESGAVVKCTPHPSPDRRMNATTIAARAASS